MSDALANWRRAVARERLIRDASFLAATESIGPFEALPLTLRHYLALRLIRSPFVASGVPTPDDAAAFLWQVSPRYNARGTGRRAFLRRCRQFTPPRPPWLHTPRAMRRWMAACDRNLARFEVIVKEIEVYVSEATIDWPPSKGEPGPSYVSEAASIIDTIACEYGWTADRIMDSPLKQLFQLMKLIRARDSVKAGKAPVMFNPSDKEKAEWVLEDTRN